MPSLLLLSSKSSAIPVTIGRRGAATKAAIFCREHEDSKVPTAIEQRRAARLLGGDVWFIPLWSLLKAIRDRATDQFETKTTEPDAVQVQIRTTMAV